MTKVFELPKTPTHVNGIKLNWSADVQALSAVAHHQLTLAALQQTRLILFDVCRSDFGQFANVLQSVGFARGTGH